jgi:hypothetical protein
MARCKGYGGWWPAKVVSIQNGKGGQYVLCWKEGESFPFASRLSRHTEFVLLGGHVEAQPRLT